VPFLIIPALLAISGVSVGALSFKMFSDETEDLATKAVPNITMAIVAAGALYLLYRKSK
jgi:hypothetical protein